jgi:hypothetical protein
MKRLPLGPTANAVGRLGTTTEDAWVVLVVAGVVVVVLDVPDALVGTGETPLPVEAWSGLTHPDGGALEPCCPGMSTVPAHPKFDKIVSPVTVEPSGSE